MTNNPRTIPHLIWIYTGSLAQTLHSATWLATTRELRKLDWRVTLVAFGPNGRHCVRGVEVQYLSTPDIYFLRQFVFHAKCMWLILREWGDTDIVLAHTISAPWFLPLHVIRFFAGKNRPLFVVDTRTLAMTLPEKETFRNKIRNMYTSFGNWMANHWADGRLAITKRMAESLQIPDDKLWGVWPSGVDLAAFSIARVSRTWPTLNDHVHIVYIGALHFERNLMTLAYAVEAANAEGMKFTLSMVGEGSEREDLIKFAAGADRRIRVIPSMQQDHLWQVLAEAHLGVLPFPDEEKFRVSSPIKLFEYMAAGLPILATRISCHTDVISNDDYAFWAKGADLEGLLEGLRSVWRERGSLAEMGGRASSAAEAWTWHESAKKLKSSLERGFSTK